MLRSYDNIQEIRAHIVITGIIPFSRLGVFYANLGSAEIFFANRKRGPQNKWQINILKHTSVPNLDNMVFETNLRLKNDLTYIILRKYTHAIGG